MGISIASNEQAWKESKSFVKRFFRADVEDFKVLVYYAISQGILTLALPLGIQILINRILATAMMSQVIWIVIWIGIGLSAATFFRIGQRKLVERLQRRFHTRVVLAASMQPSNELGDDAVRSHRYFDAFIVQKTISSLLVEGLAAVLKLGAALLLLAFYHPFFLAFDLLIIGSLYFVIWGTFGDAMKTAVNESSAKHEIANRLVKDSGVDKAEPLCLEYLETRESHFKVLLKQIYGLSMIHIFGSIFLLGVGSWLVILEQMSLGQLIAAELVFSLAFSALEKVNKHLEDFFDMFSALVKLEPVVAAPLREDERS